jgi:hypothetical protein
MGAVFSDGSQFLFRTQGNADLACTKPTGTDSTAQPLYIGGRAGTSAFLNGYIAEIIIIDGILPLSDIQAIESYLMTKYSIT